MILNDAQKIFIKDINLPIDSPSRLKDINSFFNLKCPTNKAKTSCQWVVQKVKTTINQNIYRIVTDDINATLTAVNTSVFFNDRNKAFFDTLYFLELVDFLETNKLITLIDKDPDDIKDFKIPVLEGDILSNFGIDPIDDRMWLLVKEFVLTEIVPLPDLTEFIKNGYKTKEEFEIADEINDRKHQLVVTRNSLYITIGALVISILVNIFVIYNYNNERNISIIKDFTKNDTTKIKMMNNQVFDTIKIYDTLKIK